MTDQKDFAPVYRDGDPYCTPQCPRHGLNGGGCFEGVKYCPPALRRDRDEARRGLCLMEAHSRHVEWKNKDDVRVSPKGIADEHGWQYLYAAADAED